MNKQTSPTLPRNRRRCVAVATCTLALAACGGGGGSPGVTSGGNNNGGVTPPPPVLVNAALAMQGFWTDAVPVTAAPDGATRSEAVVMPDGTGWVVFENDTAPTAVARIALTGIAVNATDATATGSGNYYRLNNINPQLNGTRIAASATGTASTRGTFTGTITVTGNAATSFNWASVAGFTTQSLAADVVGTWNTTAGSAAVVLSWTISSTGAVSGNGSTGCTYAGTLTPSPGTAVYDLSVAENCAGIVRNLAGIATLASTSTSTTGANTLRVVFTADAGATGGLFALTRQ
jgi:hypothetical protein